MMIVHLGEQKIKDLKEFWAQSYLITGYRSWPGGKKGCLAYYDYGIHLLDAPWRQYDSFGQYNILHEYEKMELSSLDTRIVGGVAAAVILKDCIKCFPDMSMEAYWSSYYQVRKTELAYKLYPSLFFNVECISWAYHNHKLLDACIQHSDDKRLKEYVQEAVKTVIHDFLNDDEVLMIKMDPRILIPINSGEGERTKNIQYSIDTFDYIWRGGYLDGIQAFLVNYAASCHIKSLVYQKKNINVAVYMLARMIDDKYDSPITIQNIGKPSDSSQLQRMYEYYINLITPKISSSLETCELEYAGGSEKKRKRMLYAFIFDEEYKSTSSLKFLKPYMKADLLQWLSRTTRIFLDYLLDKLEETEYYSKAQNKYYELYPDAIPEEEIKPDRIAEEASPSVIIPLPMKNKYNSLVQYVIERRKYDPAFAKDLDMISTLNGRCTYLGTIIGWTPEPNSLSHNLNARLRSGRDTGKLNEFPTR